MTASDHRTRLRRELLLASSDIDALAALVVRLRDVVMADATQIDRATERWIEAKIRAAELSEEIRRLDRGDGAR